MLKRSVSRLFVVVAFLVSVLPLKAQDEANNAYTPYSMFGIGEISKPGNAVNKSMGGVGLAMRDKKVVNYLNPAAVTAREEKSFMADFGLVQGNRYFAQGEYKSANNICNMYDFVISFPVWKSLAMYAGFTPYSDVAYDITDYITDPNIIGVTGNVQTASNGYGGMSNIFLGGGINVCKGLSVGTEVSHVFGTISKVNSQIFSSSSYRSIYSGYSMNLNATSVKFGAQYETKLFGNVSAVVAGTYKMSSNLKGRIQDFELCTISSVTDTVRNELNHLKNDKNVRLASECGAGIAIKGGDKWTFEIDYLRSDWSKCGFESTKGLANVSTAVFSATSSESLRAGFSIVPNSNDIRYYRKRITYRGGTYWDKAYCMLDGNAVNAYGLTFGATLPIPKWNNGITIGVDLGQRGYKGGSMIRERYINFNIGFNLFDFWFIKPVYN